MTQTTGILIVLGLLVLGAAGYLLFGTEDASSALSSSGAPVSGVEVTFLNLTAQIESVTFDTSILQDPRFRALQDLRIAVVEETTGRPDPFAPLGR